MEGEGDKLKGKKEYKMQIGIIKRNQKATMFLFFVFPSTHNDNKGGKRGEECKKRMHEAESNIRGGNICTLEEEEAKKYKEPIMQNQCPCISH